LNPHAFEITVIDDDPHYLGMEICVSNGRYTGTTFIYSSAAELRSFRSKIQALVKGGLARLEHEFGVRDAEIGGWCQLRSRASEDGDHCVEVTMSDDSLHYADAQCRLILCLDSDLLGRIEMNVGLIAQHGGEGG
jgi:hypothetical protein